VGVVPKGRILIVDDLKGIRQILASLLAKAGYDSLEAEDGQSALQLAQDHAFDAVLLDIRMPGLDGFAVLERLTASDPDLPVIMVTAYDDVDTAVKAMHLGAYHYLNKPFHGDEVVALVQRAIEHRRLSCEVRTLHERLDGEAELTRLLGTSEPVARLAEQIGRIAPTDVPVLLTGEEGSGTELVARAIHALSARAPFIALDCGAVPTDQLEREIFGFQPPADAAADRPTHGHLEFAEGGTLFLDDIPALPLAAQDHLLTFLQDRHLQAIGSAERRPIDVRVIVATSLDLREFVAGHLFRRTLYAHLAECAFFIPPLRERADDIVYLVKRTLDQVNRELGKSVHGPTPEALDLLMAHPWPGNLRELHHTIRRAVLLAADHIEPEHLGLAPAPSSGASVPATREGTHPLTLPERTRRAIREIESEAILDALRRTGGNKSAAARILGIDYKTLHVKLKKYNLRGTQEHT